MSRRKNCSPAGHYPGKKEKEERDSSSVRAKKRNYRTLSTNSPIFTSNSRSDARISIIYTLLAILSVSNPRNWPLFVDYDRSLSFSRAGKKVSGATREAWIRNKAVNHSLDFSSISVEFCRISIYNCLTLFFLSKNCEV